MWVRNRTGPHIGKKSDQTLSVFDCTSISQIFMNKLFIWSVASAHKGNIISKYYYLKPSIIVITKWNSQRKASPLHSPQYCHSPVQNFLCSKPPAQPYCKPYLSMLQRGSHIQDHSWNPGALFSPGRRDSQRLSCRQGPPYNHHQDFPAFDKRPEPGARWGARWAPSFHLLWGQSGIRGPPLTPLINTCLIRPAKNWFYCVVSMSYPCLYNHVREWIFEQKVVVYNKWYQFISCIWGTQHLWLFSWLFCICSWGNRGKKHCNSAKQSWHHDTELCFWSLPFLSVCVFVILSLSF